MGSLQHLTNNHSLDGNVGSVSGQAGIAIHNLNSGPLEHIGGGPIGPQTAPSGDDGVRASWGIDGVQGDQSHVGRGEVTVDLEGTNVHVEEVEHIVVLVHPEANDVKCGSLGDVEHVNVGRHPGQIVLGVSLQTMGSRSSDGGSDSGRTAVVAESTPLHGHDVGELALSGLLSTDDAANTVVGRREELIISNAVVAGPAEQTAHCAKEGKEGLVRWNTE